MTVSNNSLPKVLILNNYWTTINYHDHGRGSNVNAVIGLETIVKFKYFYYTLNATFWIKMITQKNHKKCNQSKIRIIRIINRKVIF